LFFIKILCFFFSSRRRHTRFSRDWSSDVCSSDLKEHKPSNSAIDAANEIGVKLLNVEEYRALQALEAFDKKTSSWIETPKKIREIGRASCRERVKIKEVVVAINK